MMSCHHNEWKFSLSQTDVMHQSVYELVHTEDQQELRRNLHWALNPPAAASTSSQDSPQGDSLFPYQLLEQLDPEDAKQDNRSSASFQGLRTGSREMVC